jgi:DNA-binding NarL/FixJ family response regulator
MRTEQHPDTGQGIKSFEPLRVLVVDDNQSIRRAIRQLLQTQVDIEVIGEAADGIDAIRKTQTYRPDVILMDAAMPTMNGFEAVRQIKKESPSTQVLMVSQFDSDAFTREALAVGAGGYILKSNASKQLIPALREICAAE